MEKLNSPEPEKGHDRYLPVLLDAREYFNEYDVAPTDILLAVVAELANTFHNEGIDLHQSYFERRFNELRDLLLSDLQVDTITIDLGKVKSQIKLLQKNDLVRQKVRERLAPQVGTIQAELNLLFIEARQKLVGHTSKKSGQGYKDFVLILDNLEKIRKMSGRDEGEESLHELFIQRAHQLNDLSAHIIYTVPLSLVRTRGPELSATYGREPFVLPMIKVERRSSQEPYEPGWKYMRELLERRVIGIGRLDEVILPEAQDIAIRFSGGSARKLMEFVQESCTYVDELPITPEAVLRAVRQTLAHYSASLRATDYEILARLNASADALIDNNDVDFRRLLEQVAIMEYVNGGDEPIIESVKPWYGVNPIVREMSQFKDAQAMRQREEADESRRTGI